MMLRQLVKVTDDYPLTEADIALITTASSLHDIGKIRIPEEILNKPGRLTDEEFKIMKKHSELGAAIIKDNGMDGGSGVAKFLSLRTEI